MFTSSILIKILIGVAWGVVLGVVTIFASKKLTLKRTDGHTAFQGDVDCCRNNCFCGDYADRNGYGTRNQK